MIDFQQTTPGQSEIENSFLEFGINPAHEAARVLASSAQIVRAILGRRAELDKAGQYNEPLIVLAGEAHNVPAQIIRHMAVLNKIKKAE